MDMSDLYLPPIFSSPVGIPPLVSSTSPVRVYQKGETIVTVGQQLCHLHYLVRGRVKYQITTPHGEETVLHFTVGPAFFGEVPFFSALPCFGSFIACEKSHVQPVERSSLSRECLEALCVQMARKIRVANLQYESTFNTAEERLARLFCTLSAEAGGMRIFSSQRELAHVAGLHYMTVNKVLKKLEDRQVIRRCGKGIEITDHAAIKTLAGLTTA